MKIGVMQPYLFPYLGYFQLIQAVDRFVLYDDVNFISRGWINRNFILSRDAPQRFTLELFGASQNKLINEIEIGGNAKKLLTTFSQSYGKAPFYNSVFPIIESCLSFPEKNLARFLEFSIRSVCSYLGIKTEFFMSSKIEKENSLKGPEKIMMICKKMGGSAYINPIGGKELYDEGEFQKNKLQLFFLQMGTTTYPQFKGEFIPNLSIVDIMMFNSQEQISRLLKDYILIQ